MNNLCQLPWVCGITLALHKIRGPAQTRAMKLSQLDVNEIYYFTRIIQAGSISAAARSLGIPKSKLSRKLSSLEKKMGITLVKRLTRSLVLTEEGKKLFERTEPHFESIMGELDTLLSPQSLLSGELRITAPMGFGFPFFMKLLGDFRRKYPSIQIHFDLLGRSQNILKGDHDVYFDSGEALQPSAVAYRLAEFDLQLFASPRYLKENGTPKNLEDLTQHQCMTFVGLKHPEKWELISKITEERKFLEVHPTLITNQPYAIKNALLDHQGIALMPTVMIKTEVKEGDLTPVLPEWHRPGGGMYMIYLKQKVRSPKVKAFVSFVRSEFSKYRELVD